MVPRLVRLYDRDSSLVGTTLVLSFLVLSFHERNVVPFSDSGENFKLARRNGLSRSASAARPVALQLVLGHTRRDPRATLENNHTGLDARQLVARSARSALCCSRIERSVACHSQRAAALGSHRC